MTQLISILKNNEVSISYNTFDRYKRYYKDPIDILICLLMNRKMKMHMANKLTLFIILIKCFVLYRIEK